MDANESLGIVQGLTSKKVLSLELDVWSARVWQFSDKDDKTVVRIGLEGYYDPQVKIVYRPSGGREGYEQAIAAGHRMTITCYTFISPEMLPQASREMKTELGKKWKVWATGSLDIMLSHLTVTEGSNGSLYLEAPMARLRGRLHGHGISDLTFKALPWEEDTIVL